MPGSLLAGLEALPMFAQSPLGRFIEWKANALPVALPLLAAIGVLIAPLRSWRRKRKLRGLHCSGERSPTAASARDASQARSQSYIGPIKSPGQLLVGAASDRTPSFSVRTLL